jgi:hypothetical protein
MAQEITANLTLKVTKSGVIYMNEYVANSLTLNASSPNVGQYSATIPTTAAGTALNLGSVAANGVFWFQNCDATNYVEVGVQVSGTFYPFIKLKAGEAWAGRLGTGVVPYARSNTASVILKHPIIDD